MLGIFDGLSAGVSVVDTGRMPARRRARPQCSECDGRFDPHPRTGKRQKTCGDECRRKRRGHQAKKRRGLKPEAFRAAERTRQAKHRRKKGLAPPMSRADLPSEVEARIEEMMAQMEARELLSRADFRRQLRRLVTVSLGGREAAEAQTGP